MTTLEDVADAYAAIPEAEAHYRGLLRQAIADGVPQVRIAEQLGVTREKLRQDAMTEEERERVRVADAKRKADLRSRAKRVPGPNT